MLTSLELSERIKEIAKEKHITMKTVLEKANLAVNTMTNMKTSYPQVNNLTKIADELNCSLDYLMGRTDSKEINKSREANK